MPPKTDGSGRGEKYGICTLLIILFYCLFIIAYPQDTKDKPKQDRNRSTKPDLESRMPPSRSDRDRGYTIGVNVDLVLMYTSAFDKKGHFVGGLKKENFKVYEDGIGQSIASFSQEDVPLSMGILMDLSGSMRRKLDQVNKAALVFIRSSNPQDQVFMIGFNDEVELIQDFTSDIDEIADALDNTVVTGGTALYDAIYLGVQKAHTGSKAKKAIVVISDGEDRDSYYKLDELVAKVQESDVQVFCVGFLNAIPDKGLFGRWSKSIPERARDALMRISEETGGKAFFPDKLEDLNGIVSEIANELRNQYSIGYFSSNAARDGSFRRVKIELAGSTPANTYLRYRRGYFAPKGEPARK